MPSLLVEVRDDRRVARAAHLVAARGELLAQLVEVVELAVEDRHDLAALALDGLLARLEVDHAQAPMAEHARAEGVGRAVVGAAVHERVEHRVDVGAAIRRPVSATSPQMPHIARSA